MHILHEYLIQSSNGVWARCFYSDKNLPNLILYAASAVFDISACVGADLSNARCVKDKSPTLEKGKPRLPDLGKLPVAKTLVGTCPDYLTRLGAAMLGKGHKSLRLAKTEAIFAFVDKETGFYVGLPHTDMTNIREL